VEASSISNIQTLVGRCISTLQLYATGFSL